MFVSAPADSSFCCFNFTKLLLRFCGKPPPLSSFTQLGLELNAGEGLGKAGLGSDVVELRKGLLRGGFCRGPLASGTCKGGFKGLLTMKGFLQVLVSSWVFSNRLARALALFGSCASVSLLVDTVFFRKVGFGGIFIALPERLSNTGFLVCMFGPEERVGCRGCLMRPAGVEEVSSMLAPLAWKRAIMAFTSALFS